jgi:hypothetical protein
MAATRVQSIGLRRHVGNPASMLQVLYTPKAVSDAHQAWKAADVAGSEGCDEKIAEARETLRQVKLGQMFFNFEKYKLTGRTRRKLEIYDTAVRRCLLYLVQRRRLVVRLQRRIRAWMFRRRTAAYHILRFYRHAMARWAFRRKMCSFIITRFMRVSYYKCLRFTYRTASRLQHWFKHFSNMRRMQAKLHAIGKEQKVARFAARILNGNARALKQLTFGSWCTFWRGNAYRRIMGESALQYATSLDELEVTMQGMLAQDPTRSPPGPEDIYVASKLKACKAAYPRESHKDITARLQAEYAELTRVETAEDAFVREKTAELSAADPALGAAACEAQAHAAWAALNHVDTPEELFREQQRADIILNLKLELAELEAEVERRSAEIFGTDGEED